MQRVNNLGQNGRRGVVLVVLALLLLGASACAVPYSEERAYLSRLFSHSRSTVQILDQLRTLAANPNMGDASWESRVNGQISALRIQIAEARNMQPPARFASFHQTYLEAMNSLEQAANLYEKAIQFRDSFQLQDASQQLEQAEGSVQQIQGQAETMMQDE